LKANRDHSEVPVRMHISLGQESNEILGKKSFTFTHWNNKQCQASQWYHPYVVQ